YPCEFAIYPNCAEPGRTGSGGCARVGKDSCLLAQLSRFATHLPMGIPAIIRRAMAQGEARRRAPPPAGVPRADRRPPCNRAALRRHERGRRIDAIPPADRPDRRADPGEEELADG